MCFDSKRRTPPISATRLERIRVVEQCLSDGIYHFRSTLSWQHCLWTRSCTPPIVLVIYPNDLPPPSAPFALASLPSCLPIFLPRLLHALTAAGSPPPSSSLPLPPPPAYRPTSCRRRRRCRPDRGHPPPLSLFPPSPLHWRKRRAVRRGEEGSQAAGPTDRPSSYMTVVVVRAAAAPPASAQKDPIAAEQLGHCGILAAEEEENERDRERWGGRKGDPGIPPSLVG